MKRFKEIKTTMYTEDNSKMNHFVISLIEDNKTSKQYTILYFDDKVDIVQKLNERFKEDVKARDEAIENYQVKLSNNFKDIAEGVLKNYPYKYYYDDSYNKKTNDLKKKYETDDIADKLMEDILSDHIFSKPSKEAQNCTIIEKELSKFDIKANVHRHSLFGKSYYLIQLEDKYIFENDIANALHLHDEERKWVELYSYGKYATWALKEDEFNNKYCDENGILKILWCK